MYINKLYFKYATFSIGIAIILFTITYLIELRFESHNFHYKTTLKYNNKLLELETERNNVIDSLIKCLPTDNYDIFFKRKDLLNLAADKNIFLFIYFKDSLKFWNSNSVEIPEEILKKYYRKFNNSSFPADFASMLNNGFYYIRIINKGEFIITGAILIKRNYAYQNDYLKNNFNQSLDISEDILLSEEKNDYNIFSRDNKFLFSIKFPYLSSAFSSHQLMKLIPIILAIIATLICIFFISKAFFNDKLFSSMIFILLLLIFRWISFYYKIPELLYDSSIFSPIYYASSQLMRSLGDLVLHSTVLLLIIYKITCIENIKLYLKKWKSAKTIILALILIASFNQLYVYILKDIILNSNIRFSFSNVFQLTVHSFFALFILANFCISYFLIVRFFLSIANCKFNVNSWKLAMLFLFLFSAYSTFLINKYNDIKERVKRKHLAVKLAEKGDPRAEYEFAFTRSKILSDKFISEKIKYIDQDENETQLKDYIQKNYFSGYWKAYNLQITFCKPNDSVMIKPRNIKMICKDFFQNMIIADFRQTLTPDLFYKSKESVSNSYIAVLKFNVADHAGFTENNIFLELDSKFITKDLGYPQLLIDKRLNISANDQDYSYAKYKNNELIYRYGKYLYKSHLDSNSSNTVDFLYFNKNNFNHLLHISDKSTVFIVSKEKETFFQKLSPFSYLILFLGLYLFILILLINIDLSDNNRRITLQGRIEISVVSIVILSFVSIGALSALFINETNNNKIEDTLKEKTHSILIEIENKLSHTDKIDPAMQQYVSGILLNLSNVFFTDINLYDLNGKLISTSRQKIYSEGLLAENIEPSAFNKMKYDKSSLFLQKEFIGKMKYYSSYTPLRNFHNQTLGYVNLPYFSRETDYRNEISAFLTTFINVYIIIATISLIIILLISGYITRPLKLLQEKIANIRFGKTNEKIDWAKEDELGELINEYNRMIDKIELSAEILAKTEREEAWREMAKQVAHEIKNPLTPMKLSVQHLLRVCQGDPEELKLKIEKISATLIEQIDLLSDIASEFSDFARMTQTTLEKTDLKNVITSAVKLYENQQGIKIIFNPSEIDYFVYADSKQLIRVFSNLIKNAVQAIEEKINTQVSDKNDIVPSIGKIDIEIYPGIDYYLIKIADNGLGISQDDISKIFTINFTTKTAGSGLGLALSKNIIEASGGKIWFETQLNIGSAFYISLPVFHKSER